MTDVLQKAPICQARPLDPPWAIPGGTRLPGMAPIGADDWHAVDDAYARQMALRDRLIAGRAADVIAARPGSETAQAEMLETALDALARHPAFDVTPEKVRRPDGITVPLSGPPLAVLGRLIQEDVCLLERTGDQHAMTAAVLCFPASWSLDEKLGRPLTGIHAPVEVYDTALAARVQRLFDAIRPGRPLLRANCLAYHDFALHQPRRENDRREKPAPGAARYIRMERQCLLRLPRTGAVAFTIHTTIVRREALGPDDARALRAHLAGAPA